MGKLIKYELKKQMFSKIVLLCIAAGLELLCAAGLVFDNGDWMGIAVALLSVLAVFGIFYLSIEVIVTYSNDMKTKTSYMLFLTPRTSYQIVGAKLLTMVIQLAGAAFVFGGLFALNCVLILLRYSSIRDILEGLQAFFMELSGIQVRVEEIVLACLMIFVAWLFVVMLAMFSITLSTTFLANKKWKGAVSAALFFLLDWLSTKLVSGLLSFFPAADEIVTEQGHHAVTLVSYSHGLVSMLFYALMIILTYLGTSYMLEKKVSV